MAKPEIELIVRGVWCRSGRVLLCRNRKAQNVFLPGGHVDFAESAAAALARELMEEAALPIRVGRFLGAVEASFKQAGQRHHEVNLLFAFAGVPPKTAAKGRKTKWPAVVSREDHIEFVWAGLADLGGPKPSLRLLPREVVAFVFDAAVPGAMAVKGQGGGAGWASAME